jgi:hypothetical protein
MYDFSVELSRSPEFNRGPAAGRNCALCPTIVALTSVLDLAAGFRFGWGENCRLRGNGTSVFPSYPRGWSRGSAPGRFRGPSKRAYLPCRAQPTIPAREMTAVTDGRPQETQ